MVRVSGNNKKSSQSQSGHEPGAKTKPTAKASPMAKARTAAKAKTTSKTKHASKTKQTGKGKRRVSSDSHPESKKSGLLNSDEEPCEF